MLRRVPTCRWDPSRRLRRPRSPVTSDIPAGWTAHDVEARNKVRRYLGDLVKALPAVYPAAVAAKLGDILGAEDDYPGTEP